MTFRSLTIVHAITGDQVGAFEIGFFFVNISKNCCPVVIPKSWETPESMRHPKGFHPFPGHLPWALPLGTAVTAPAGNGWNKSPSPAAHPELLSWILRGDCLGQAQGESEPPCSHCSHCCRFDPAGHKRPHQSHVGKCYWLHETCCSERFLDFSIPL